MKRQMYTSLFVISFFVVPLAAENVARTGESVFDEVVRIEEDVSTVVPAVPRLEERLELTVRRVDVGGAELHVEEEGAGVPMVLISGGPGGTHHYFHPWFGRAAEFARVIYYDQRGTGLSDYEPGERGYSVEQAVNDLDALRAALEIDRWVLVGFSYGGFLAQYYTTTYPQNVAGLVLVGASPGMWTDLGNSQQQRFISEDERKKMGEIRDELRRLREQHGWSRDRYVRLLIYNNHINGDWKRQSLYRPSPEEFAYGALYEWVHDSDFNSILNRSANKVDLTGAFERNPIPTLLLEGKWDLTWGLEKPTILSRNHPRSRMVVIEGAGHAIYNENPGVFFAELEGFVRALSPVVPAVVEAYRRDLTVWRARWERSPRYHIESAGWGKSGSLQIVEAYTAEWMERLKGSSELLRVGFALYDAERYEQALSVFAKLEQRAEDDGNRNRAAMALIWQGHMLDLLARRDEAVALYRRVAEMGLEDGMRHDQYDLAYEYSPYAASRVDTPFQRIENADP
jgi:proline iminopeptidase